MPYSIQKFIMLQDQDLDSENNSDNEKSSSNGKGIITYACVCCYSIIGNIIFTTVVDAEMADTMNTPPDITTSDMEQTIGQHTSKTRTSFVARRPVRKRQTGRSAAPSIPVVRKSYDIIIM